MKEKTKMESTEEALNKIEENKNILKDTLKSLMEGKDQIDKFILKMKGYENHGEVMDRVNKELKIKYPSLDVFLQKQFNEVKDKVKSFYPEGDNNKLGQSFGEKSKIKNKYRRSFV